MNKTLNFNLKIAFPEELDNKDFDTYLEDMLRREFPYHKMTITPQKFRYENNTEFPILFENHEIRIFKNTSDEIYVENVRSNVDIRINAGFNALIFTTTYVVEPTYVNGMIGWQIGDR